MSNFLSLIKHDRERSERICNYVDFVRIYLNRDREK